MLRIASALVCLALCGCGGKTIYPIKGRVHFADGAPLVNGRVVLDTGQDMTGSWGSIRPDGTFVMGTFTDRDGVPAGSWRVSIQSAMSMRPPDHDDAPFTAEPLIHERFGDPETSDLVFEVPQQLEWDITVDKP
jgi:hypothetical protein